MTMTMMMIDVCECSEYRLRVRPRGSWFTKPLGSSIVLTCELESTGARESVRVSSLQWLDGRRSPITDSPGRSAVQLIFSQN